MSLCVLVFILICGHARGMLVGTNEGLVQGYRASDGHYYQFHGIPYAGPAAGYYRFKAPIPPLQRSEIFHANDSSILCAQPSVNGLVGVENCLTLNIFTSGAFLLKPVVVWLNAEDYTTSTIPQFSVKNFVEENIVFVTLNFRLSIFGFLCLRTESAPGNAGLKDVIQGLRWIHDNIEGFGGKPNDVTLMGHASGAAMVDLITMAPQAKGLVHKAIAMSGSGLSSWAVAYDPIGYAQILAAKLGYKSSSNEDLAVHLVTTDSAVLNSALIEYLHFKNNTPLFAPCVENRSIKPNDTVLSDAPIKLMRSGKYLQIPYIASYTSREGTMRIEEAISDNWLKEMNENFVNFMPVDLKMDYLQTLEVADKITRHYFTNEQQLVTMANLDDYLKYEGDVMVTTAVISGAIERSKSSKGEVRLLIFGYIGTNNSDWPYKQIQLNGVKHGGLLNYLFDYDLTPEDKQFMSSIVKRFTTFIKTGTQVSVHELDEWLPINASRLYTLSYPPQLFGNDNYTIFVNETDSHLALDTWRLWRDVYHQYYKAQESINSAGSRELSMWLIFGSVVICTVSNLFEIVYSHEY